MKKKSLVGWIREDWFKRFLIKSEDKHVLPTVHMPNIFKNKSAFDREWIKSIGADKNVKIRITIMEIMTK